mgnify:CR=1 FL=1
MDEQTGKAGYVTRLEAFVDLMRRRKLYKKKKSFLISLFAIPIAATKIMIKNVIIIKL